MYHVGDYVVYGAQGVCKVLDIGKRQHSSDFDDEFDVWDEDDSTLYYTLSPCYEKDVKIYTPIDNQKVVMRPVMEKESTLKLIEDIDDIDIFGIKDEKKRDEVFRDAIKTGDCRQLVKVIKTLNETRRVRIRNGKKMTSSDENYYKKAEKRLYGEIAVSLGMHDALEAKEFVTGKISEDTMS